MVRLLPYSVYEKEALEDYFSKQAAKGQQFSWRFGCFLGFRKAEPETTRVCLVYAKPSRWRLFYRNALEAGIYVRRQPREEQDVSALLKSDSAFMLGAFSVLLLLLLALLGKVLFFPAASVASLWTLMGLASIILLPLTLFSGGALLHHFLRYRSVRAHLAKGTPYRARKNYGIYTLFLLVAALCMGQLCADALAESKAEADPLYRLSADTYQTPDASPLSFATLLEPLSWQYFNGQKDVRITYHECLFPFLAKQYYAQAQRDFADVNGQEESMESLLLSTWETERGFFFACLSGREVVTGAFSASDSAARSLLLQIAVALAK